MNKDTTTTKVIFRIFEGNVIAIFPGLAGDFNPYRTCLSYMHVEQHRAVDISLRGRRLATEKEYSSLKDELESIGYSLKVVKRITRKDLEERKRECGGW